MRMKSYDALSSVLCSLVHYMHDVGQSIPMTGRYVGVNCVILSKHKTTHPACTTFYLRLPLFVQALCLYEDEELCSLVHYMHDVDQSTSKTVRYVGVNGVILSKNPTHHPCTTFYHSLSMFALGVQGFCSYEDEEL